MAQRILTLSVYLLRHLILSLTGIIYLLLTLVFWRLFFDPRQATPEPAYYVLVIGLFGAGTAFLITLSVAARAYRAQNYPLLARLPSRIEHLSATLLTSISYVLFLQLLLAALATFRGPSLSIARILEIPPVWIAVDLLSIVLALHASDMVTSGWSRVYVYGLLAVLLFGRELDTAAAGWISNRILDVGGAFFRLEWTALGNASNTLARWLAGEGGQMLGQLFDAVFWPLRAMVEAVVAGFFTPLQALAPAMVVLYATALFLLAADLYARKDLFLTE